MDVKAAIREKEKQVLSMYPAEQERLEQCTRLVFEQDNDLLYNAYLKQLDRILSANSPDKARKHIDKMEHTLTQSSLISPLMDNSPEGKRRGVIIAMLVIIALVLLTGIELLIGYGAI